MDGVKSTEGVSFDTQHFHPHRYDLHDIVAVFSLWDMGCDESWLDGCTGCGGCCDLASASVTFSNFELSPAKQSSVPEIRELIEKYN